MRIVVCITGASGAVLGVRLLEELRARGVETYAVVSAAGNGILAHELPGIAVKADHVHDPDDLAAPIASSTYPVDAVVVAPCSAKTLSAVANDYEHNLVVRAVSCCLKQERPVILLPRETPYTLAYIENLRKAKLNGCTILPPNVAYYTRPGTVDDVTDFFVGRVLDLLGLEHTLYKPWEGITS